MPFREKLKKAFKSSSASSSKTNSPVIEQDTTRWPSNVYKPGEPMPRPKYRAPVKKEHKDKLESFNFGSSWRRRSHHSVYSPMGSRLPSRKSSVATRRPSIPVNKRPSFSGRSRKSVSGASVAVTSGPASGRESIDTRMAAHNEGDGSKEPSRSGSIAGTEKKFKDGLGAARVPRLSTEVEAEGDDDITNVGLSRVNSHDKPVLIDARTQTPPKADSGTSQHGHEVHKVGLAGHDHRPFSEEDLVLALERSNLVVPAQP